MKTNPLLGLSIRFSLLGLLLMLSGVAKAAVVEADVCVYGGTSGGVAAAVQAARMGKKTIIAEPGKHLGGMTSGGLSAVDIGDPRTVGGIAREYFTRLVASYGQKLQWDKAFESVAGGPATGGAYSIEPHVAEQVFTDMAKEAKVGLHFSARLASVKKNGAHITEFVTEDGTVFRAKMFIDATYEGDLMAKAGVSYTVMREGNAKYGETYNGIHYTDKYLPRTNHQKPGPSGRVPGGQGVWDRDFPLDPYVIPGDPKSGLLPLIQAGEPGKQGDPAPGVQAYCYRLCLTTNANRIPITAPTSYDPKRYEIIARFIAACLAIGDDMDLRWFSKYDPLPNGKWDFNTATFGGNLPGASWAWPDASYAQRTLIAKEHEEYHRGLLYFLATDPRVPVKVRDEVKRFGLPRDEFTDNGGWPHQLYIREGRRMVSDLVLTEHHTFGKEVAPNSVSLGSYGTDTHEIRRIVKNGVVAREGKTAGGRDGFGPYQIGYAAIVPKQSECDNLFVTFALSASHTAFSSIRMEPVFMVTSQSAATAASQSIDDGVPVQKLDYPKLRTRLLADGQIIESKATTKPAAAPKKAAPKAKKTATAPKAPDYVGQLAATLEPTRTVVYKKIGDRELHLHIFEPKDLKTGDQRPCFITIHGGGWTGGEPRRMFPFAADAASKGMVGISVEYRLLKAGSGVTVFDCVKDGRSAVRYVRAHARELGVNVKQIIANGASAGGHVAVGTTLFTGVDESSDDLSISCVPDALVLHYPVIDTSTEGYGNAKIGALWRELSPLHQVRAQLPPTIIFHGTSDTTTPFKGAQGFYDAMVKAGNRCELVVNEGGVHGYFTRDRALCEEVIRKTDVFLASVGMATSATK